MKAFGETKKQVHQDRDPQTGLTSIPILQTAVTPRNAAARFAPKNLAPSTRGQPDNDVEAQIAALRGGGAPVNLASAGNNIVTAVQPRFQQHHVVSDRCARALRRTMAVPGYETPSPSTAKPPTGDIGSRTTSLLRGVPLIVTTT